VAITDHTKSSTSVMFNVPSDFKKFTFDYNNSKFIECDEQLVYRNQRYSYMQNQELNLNVSKDLSYLSQILVSRYKHFWLSGGTLLGNFHTSFISSSMFLKE